MLVSWRGPACLAGTIPQPAHPIGYAVARPKGRAFIRARRVAARSPFPRRSLRSLPPSPSRPFGAQQEKRIPERGKGALYRQPLRCACGRRNQRLCGRHRRALSWGAPAPMPPEAACGRVGAPLARIAPPNPAAPAIAQARRHAPRAARCQRRPLGLCIAPRSIVQAPPAGGSAARAAGPSSSLRRCGSRGQPARRGWLPLSWLLGQSRGLLRLHRRPGSISLAFPGCCSPGPRGSRFCCIFSRSVLQTFVRYGTIVLVGFVCSLLGASSTLWPFGAICFTGRCCPWNTPSCCLARIAVARPKSSTCKWPMASPCMLSAAIAAPAARVSSFAMQREPRTWPHAPGTTAIQMLGGTAHEAHLPSALPALRGHGHPAAHRHAVRTGLSGCLCRVRLHRPHGARVHRQPQRRSAHAAAGQAGGHRCLESPRLDHGGTCGIIDLLIFFTPQFCFACTQGAPPRGRPLCVYTSSRADQRAAASSLSSARYSSAAIRATSCRILRICGSSSAAPM